MLRTSRIAMALAIGGASFGFSVLLAAPASACTGDPCDGFCITYDSPPPAVQQKVFHSDECPIR